MKTVIFSPNVARSKSPHAHAVRVGGLVFVSGIPGFDDEATVRRGDFAHQMRQSLKNIEHILHDAGSSLDQVVKVNVILASETYFEEMNGIYREFFGNDETRWPARTTIAAKLPREDFLLEIECVAEAAAPASDGEATTASARKSQP